MTRNGITINDLYDKQLNALKSKYNDPKYYISRELSWMEFNKRVLHQSFRKEVPLLERLKFLGITASNLDEFIMVRMASLLNKIRSDVDDPEISGLLPEEEYDLLFQEVIGFKKMQEDGYVKLTKKMEKNNRFIVKFKDLDKEEKEYVEKLFLKFIYPLLTPITFDTTKDFPLIKSRQLNIIVALEDKKLPNLNVVSIIPIDGGMDRLYPINVKNKDRAFKYILLEEIIFNFLHKLFVNKDIIYKGAMRIVRQADIELNRNKDVYIVDRMKQTLLQRENSNPIFMDIDEDVPKQVLKLLVKIFDLDKESIYKAKTIIDLSFLVGMPIHSNIHEYEPFSPQYPEELVGEHDMFTAIDNNDIILHHPFESFGPVVKFLEHAADDKDVLAIKQTLYRVSSADSPIVEALCRAARKGKQVSILLEIKARFDENRNMSLIEKLRISGCKIIYGIEGLKTHCKFILVVKRSKKGLKTYCHVGTGNYNDKTSSIYTDLSLFTSSGKIGEDILSIFNILSGFSDPRDDINKIFYSPYNIRTKLYELIDREIAFAEKGKNAFITLKLNSLSDLGIIRKLYEASEKGVHVNIICRGICSMKPINKNISIRSVVGRFLEHSRIYYFYNNEKPDIYISSADMLTRNLDRRIEIMVPLTDGEVRSKVFGILKQYFNDNVNTYVMNKEGQYKLLEKSKEMNVHEFFMTEAIEHFKLQSIPKFSLKK